MSSYARYPIYLCAVKKNKNNSMKTKNQNIQKDLLN